MRKEPDSRQGAFHCTFMDGVPVLKIEDKDKADPISGNRRMVVEVEITGRCQILYPERYSYENILGRRMVLQHGHPAAPEEPVTEWALVPAAVIQEIWRLREGDVQEYGSRCESPGCKNFTLGLLCPQHDSSRRPVSPDLHPHIQVRTPDGILFREGED